MLFWNKNKRTKYVIICRNSFFGPETEQHGIKRRKRKRKRFYKIYSNEQKKIYSEQTSTFLLIVAAARLKFYNPEHSNGGFGLIGDPIPTTTFNRKSSINQKAWIIQQVFFFGSLPGSTSLIDGVNRMICSQWWSNLNNSWLSKTRFLKKLTCLEREQRMVNRDRTTNLILLEPEK